MYDHFGDIRLDGLEIAKVSYGRLPAETVDLEQSWEI